MCCIVWMDRASDCAQRVTKTRRCRKKNGTKACQHLFSWKEWQAKLKSAFPAEENYGQMLTDMLAKRARFGESLEDYFYKVALLNRCGIIDKRAVECILHGVDDRSVRLGAEAAQFSDPDRLLAYLRNVKAGNSTRNYNSGAKRVRELKPITNSSINYSTSKLNNIRCYNCKQDGHPSSKCTKPLKKCTNCLMLGHTEPECFRAKKDINTENKKEQSVLAITETS